MQHHGDDLYNYPNIQINFSSNIWTHADLSLLKEHLSKRLDLIRNYPEPEARSLEKILAERLGISQEEILVTNGATDAIRLIANSFSEKNQVTLHPTFSEYPEKKGREYSGGSVILTTRQAIAGHLQNLFLLTILTICMSSTRHTKATP